MVELRSFSPPASSIGERKEIVLSHISGAGPPYEERYTPGKALTTHFGIIPRTPKSRQVPRYTERIHVFDNETYTIRLSFAAQLWQGLAPAYVKPIFTATL